MTPRVGRKPGRVLPALVVALALVGCASEPKVRVPGGPGPRTAECTQPGGWAGWTGGMTASGSTAFCGQPRR
jgi:hypothetical protein